MSNPQNINFWSEKNYLKRDSSTGSTSVAAPATSAYLGGLYITQLVIPHTLGIIPYHKVYYEAFNDNVIWEATSSRLVGNFINPRNTAQTGPYCISWADTTAVTIELGYTNNTLTGNYPVYYVIYRDYALA